MRTTLVVLAAIFSSAYGDSIRQKLGQIQSKNLAQAESEQLGDFLGDCGCATPPPLVAVPPDLGDIDLDWCDCNLTVPIIPGAGSGAANVQAYTTSGSVSSGVSNIDMPNYASSQTCESDCCACSAAEESSAAIGYKTRVFDIGGKVTVTETVTLREYTNATEQSIGESHKVAACATTNQIGGSGAPPRSGCVAVCLNGTITTMP